MAARWHIRGASVGCDIQAAIRFLGCVAVLAWAIGSSACALVDPVPDDPVASRSKRRPRPKPRPAPKSPVETPPDVVAPTPPAPALPAEPGVEEGEASFYSDRLAGRRTANGERYRPNQATCAHRTHAFGTVLVVTVVDSGSKTTCRVNDRGPWAKGRILDVSRSVAKRLGFVSQGVARVRLEPVAKTPTGGAS